MASVGAARKAEKRPQMHANSSSSSPPLHPPSQCSSFENASGGEGSNVDRVLYKNLVDMVPLVESLMDRRPNPSFKRRASLVYTPTPSHPRKVVDHNGRITAQTCSFKKRSDHGNNGPNKESDKLDGASGFFSSSALTAEDVQKNVEELKLLQEQLDDLHKKLLEKDEALKSLKDSLNEMNVANATVNELKEQLMEKDSLITNANLQLTNTKNRLDERQAALEKLEMEVTESNKKVEELQGILDSTSFEIAAFTKLFDELSNTCPDACLDDNNTSQPMDMFPYIDDIDENGMQKMEEARIAYVAAVATAKENPSEESIAAAAEARVHLQAYLLNCH
ncbi:protein MICROTUBULE BINDING PROTEIN 2C-like isoform X2 [Musa acuminata AAA Group]|uniref:protein MICROTUBULE BINDING PROTEIN 2C-like isoform X2 n=1 Tax=Musa acuminata AAA Group TaxID=214697 RepID=UPI0031E3EEA7